MNQQRGTTFYPEAKSKKVKDIYNLNFSLFLDEKQLIICIGIFYRFDAL